MITLILRYPYPVVIPSTVVVDVALFLSPSVTRLVSTGWYFLSRPREFSVEAE